MKRFRFRLEPVRLVRELAESRARGAYVLARRSFDTACRQAEDAAIRLEAAMGRSRTERSRTMSASQHAMYLQEIADSDQAHRLALAEMEKQRKEMQRRESDWTEARRRLKFIERLKESALLEHQTKEIRIEQEALDEIAVMRSNSQSL